MPRACHYEAPPCFSNVSRFYFSADFSDCDTFAFTRTPPNRCFRSKTSENSRTGVLSRAKMCHDPKFRAIFGIVTHPPLHKYPRTTVSAAESAENGSMGASRRARMCHDPKLWPIFRIVTQKQPPQPPEQPHQPQSAAHADRPHPNPAKRGRHKLPRG